MDLILLKGWFFRLQASSTMVDLGLERLIQFCLQEFRATLCIWQGQHCERPLTTIEPTQTGKVGKDQEGISENQVKESWYVNVCHS